MSSCKKRKLDWDEDMKVDEIQLIWSSDECSGILVSVFPVTLTIYEEDELIWNCSE